MNMDRLNHPSYCFFVAYDYRLKIIILFYVKFENRTSQCKNSKTRIYFLKQKHHVILLIYASYFNLDASRLKLKNSKTHIIFFRTETPLEEAIPQVLCVF